MKYIGFYDTEVDRRAMSLAAVNKMNYISKTLVKIGNKVSIISCGMIAKFDIAECDEVIDKDIIVHYFKTNNKAKSKYKRIYNVIRQSIKIFNHLLKNISNEEKIIVYHSLGLMRAVYWAKKIKHFKLILEVEEFYNDVYLKSQSSKKMEEKFIESADAYIFPTELLNEKFNKENKPYVIIHGTYKVEEDRKVSFNDNKIHVVYAGTLDPQKGGAVAAAAAAEWLPENYHMHILGFGSDSQIKYIKEKISDINKQSDATVTYDGLLSGEEYIQFLQKCHIGLSTQNPVADFNDTSFPSKILSYMANGLRVVTIRIPAIETSDIGQDVYYYDKQDPKEIAKVILNIDIKLKYSSREKITQLDKKFTNDLRILIGGRKCLK